MNLGKELGGSGRQKKLWGDAEMIRSNNNYNTLHIYMDVHIQFSRTNLIKQIKEKQRKYACIDY